MPLSEIYGIASFYAQFTLTRGKTDQRMPLEPLALCKGIRGYHEKVCEKVGCEAGFHHRRRPVLGRRDRCIGGMRTRACLTINEEVYGRLEVGQ